MSSVGSSSASPTNYVSQLLGRSTSSNNSSASSVLQLLGAPDTTPSSNSILNKLDAALHKSVVPAKSSAASQLGNLGLSAQVLNLLQGGTPGADILSNLLGTSVGSTSVNDAASKLLRTSLSSSVLQSAQNAAAQKKYNEASKAEPIQQLLSTYKPRVTTTSA